MLTNELPDAILWALKLEAKKSGCSVDKLTNKILSDWLVGKGYFMMYEDEENKEEKNKEEKNK